MADFVDWLRRHNERLPSGHRNVGFYGLISTTCTPSMQAVVRYLETVDADEARLARARYACFDRFGDDPQRYGYAAAVAASPTCEDEVVAQLRDLYQQADQYVRRDGFVAEDEFFYAEQNARLVQHAEEYYRCLSVIDTWPIRLTPSWPIWDVMVARRGFRCGPTIRISAMRGRRPWGDGANGTWGN